ncbi:MAG: hypothetical protein ACE15C_12830 [Phycisphaerae bacterium]
MPHESPLPQQEHALFLAAARLASTAWSGRDWGPASRSAPAPVDATRTAAVRMHAETGLRNRIPRLS